MQAFQNRGSGVRRASKRGRLRFGNMCASVSKLFNLELWVRVRAERVPWLLSTDGNRDCSAFWTGPALQPQCIVKTYVMGFVHGHSRAQRTPFRLDGVHGTAGLSWPPPPAQTGFAFGHDLHCVLVCDLRSRTFF